MLIHLRKEIRFVALLLIAAGLAVYGFNHQPTFTDAFYHYNAAVRVAAGKGLTDPYLWTYIGAPDTLPAPSHLYWMPGTSLIAAAGMAIFGQHYAAAQIGLVLCVWIAALAAYWFAQQLSLARWQAQIGAVSVIIGGFFLAYWGQTDTFAPYAAVGSLALISIGLGSSSRSGFRRWWILAGIFCGIGHLIRNDGLLLLLTALAVLAYPFSNPLTFRRRMVAAVLVVLAYLLVMAPWFWRNLQVLGTILPAGGIQGAWFLEYNDLFNYPPDATIQTLFADGGTFFLQSRFAAIFSANGAILNFIAVEGSILLAPFLLIAFWNRRHTLILRPVWIFAVGLHLAFTIVFTLPGIRGGLFHGAAALVPFWMVLGWAGIDDVVRLVARRRRWNVRTAVPVFSGGALVILLALSLVLALPRRSVVQPPIYAAVAEILPENSLIMANDPAQLYYYTGFGGVGLPNETPEIALQIARQYGVGYLLLQQGGITDPMIFAELPAFLTPIELPLDGAWLYAFELE